MILPRARRQPMLSSFLLFLLLMIFSYSKYICCSSYIVSLSHVVIVIMHWKQYIHVLELLSFLSKTMLLPPSIKGCRLATDFARQSSQFKRPWISDRVNKLGVFPSSGGISPLDEVFHFDSGTTLC
jgi:hypothetical protein